MEQYLPVIRQSLLFRQVEPDKLPAMLQCLQARIHSYEKGEYIFCQGQEIEALALVLSGSVNIQRENYWGNLHIMETLAPGESFGAAYAAPGGGPLPNDVVAAERCIVLRLDLLRVLTLCSNACPFHGQLQKNLFSLTVKKNRQLVQKIDCISQRSTREKLLRYLQNQSCRAGSREFDIPFNRQQLADYLAVDRSAMSGELCRMQRDGLVSFCKNHFILHNPSEKK